jgi:hypothetical protein
MPTMFDWFVAAAVGFAQDNPALTNPIAEPIRRVQEAFMASGDVTTIPNEWFDGAMAIKNHPAFAAVPVEAIILAFAADALSFAGAAHGPSDRTLIINAPDAQDVLRWLMFDGYESYRAHMREEGEPASTHLHLMTDAESGVVSLTISDTPAFTVVEDDDT